MVSFDTASNAPTILCSLSAISPCLSLTPQAPQICQIQFTKLLARIIHHPSQPTHQSTHTTLALALRARSRANKQVRRRFKGQIPMPKIGYGSNKKTRHLLPSGHKELVVRNVNDLDLLLMHNNKYAAAIAHSVSSKKRIDILARAKVLGVKVTNAAAKIRTEEA